MRKIIFSPEPRYRIQRHLIFWAVQFLLIFLYSYGIPVLTYITSGDDYYLDNFAECYEVSSFRLFVDIVYCYLVVYWLIPKFLYRKKFVLFGTLLALFTLATLAFISIFTISYYNLTEYTETELYHSLWYQTIHFVLSGSPTVCAVFLALKILKTWYLKQDEKVAIAQANAQAELQLLKAQIHPHFLFNTLNNIYSFSLLGHPRAPELAGRFSDMMDYMSSEGEKERVPLEKEIALIRDYIALEKVRYGDRLDIEVRISGDTKNKIIAPLLMIPFAENCFKHGASAMRGRQWVRLEIFIKDNRLYFELSNSKPQYAPERTNEKKGLGLSNVKKRLQLIYPGQHVLQTENTDTVYKVHLEVNLELNTVLPVYTNQTMSYV